MQVNQVNNAIYEQFGHMWWDDAAGFEITSLRFCINPVRYGYFSRLLKELKPGNAVLDLGCGGGFLAEEFAKDGYEVTGVDPAANSITCAQEHAGKAGLPISYRIARGEALPFAESSFDIVACCDVLEHVDDPARVIREISRVLRPGGVFLFDTVNRTRRSKFVVIKIWQDWHLMGVDCPNVHVWEKFITPAELAELMRSSGIAPGSMRGITAAKRPLALLYTFWRIRTGRVPAGEVAQAFPLRETGDLSVSYMGWARKTRDRD